MKIFIKFLLFLSLSLTYSFAEEYILEKDLYENFLELEHKYNTNTNFVVLRLNNELVLKNKKDSIIKQENLSNKLISKIETKLNEGETVIYDNKSNMVFFIEQTDNVLDNDDLIYIYPLIKYKVEEDNKKTKEFRKKILN